MRPGDWKSRSANVTVLLMFAERTRWNLQVNEFSQALERRRRSGAEVFDLTASNPTTVGLSYDESVILSALSRRESLIYEPDPKGLKSARRAAAPILWGFIAGDGIRSGVDHSYGQHERGVLLPISTTVQSGR